MFDRTPVTSLSLSKGSVKPIDSNGLKWNVTLSGILLHISFLNIREDLHGMKYVSF